MMLYVDCICCVRFEKKCHLYYWVLAGYYEEERQLTGKSTAIDFVYLLNSVPESAVTQAHISEKRQVHIKVDTTGKYL